METVSKIEGKPRNENEMAELFEIDKDLWYPENIKTSAYEGQQKDAEGNPVILTLYRTFINWKLKHPALEFKDVLEEVFKNSVPPHVAIVKAKTKGELLGVLLHTDKHIDRIEHDKDYLKKINDRTYQLIQQMKKLDVGKFVYADLGDLFNSNTNYKTERLTQQYNNETEAESFKTGLENELKLIKMMEEEFKNVLAIYVPGNHDFSKQNWMAQALNLYFKNNPNVDVDDRDLIRKYIEYGKNTIGLQHGHLVPRRRMLETYTSEQNLKDYNYMFQGHIHHEMVKQYGKLLIESLGSPAKPSERERQNGYVSDGKIKAMLFDKDRGRIATLEG